MTTTAVWSRRYPACRRCGHTRWPHKARGYCGHCYGVLYRAKVLVGTFPHDDQFAYEEQERQLAYEEAALDLWDATVSAEWLLSHARVGHPVVPVDVLIVPRDSPSSLDHRTDVAHGRASS